MKKLTFTFILSIGLIFNALAQIEAGNVFLGGNLSFYSQSQKTGNGTPTKASYFSIIPEVGYVVAENFAISLGVGYSQYLQKDSYKESTFSVLPGLRYYVATSGESFYFFGQLRGNIGFGNRVDDPAGNKLGKRNEISVYLSPNFAYFPSEGWAIEFGIQGIGYSSSTYTPEVNPDMNKQTNSNFSFDFSSFYPNLGVKAFF